MQDDIPLCKVWDQVSSTAINVGAEMQPPPPAISEQAASSFTDDQGEKSLLFTF